MTYYEDDTVTLHHGDALDVLRTMPDGSVDCCVTSPPYFGLRDYGVAGQIGAEKSPAEFVERLRVLFAEVRRVLADDGTCWLNLGDSYASTTSNNGGYSGRSGLRDGKLYDNEKGLSANLTGDRRALHPGVAAKNLLGIPWRVAIIWHKPNAMPESVTDRLSTRYEMVFMLTKSKRYWFDLDPIREVSTDFEHKSRYAEGRYRQRTAEQDTGVPGAQNSAGIGGPGRIGTGLKNPGDVWSIVTTPFGGAHFAAYPPELVKRCILAGCKPGGTVLDPFSGSGTTGMVALKHGRKYVGIDLNAEYLDLSLRTRLHTGTLDFGGAA